MTKQSKALPVLPAMDALPGTVTGAVGGLAIDTVAGMAMAESGTMAATVDSMSITITAPPVGFTCTSIGTGASLAAGVAITACCVGSSAILGATAGVSEDAVAQKAFAPGADKSLSLRPLIALNRKLGLLT